MNWLSLLIIVDSRKLMASSLLLHNTISLSQRPNANFRAIPEELTQETESNNREELSSSNSACPFSKHFPRYRIQLTTKTTGNRDDNIYLDKILDFLPSIPWKKSMQIDQIKRKYGDVTDNFKHAENTDGILALTLLWKEAAILMRILHNEHQDDKNGNNSNNNNQFSSSVSVIVLLPDSSMEFIRNFCEIVKFMESNFVVSDFVLDAQALEGNELPIIRLEMRVKQKQGQFTGNNINGITASNDIIGDKHEYKEIVNERTRSWVQRLLVSQGICPFTRSSRMSGQGLTDLGVKPGSIAYNASLELHPIGLFADTWDSIDRMIKAGPEGKQGVSSILLTAPAFDDDFDLWSGPIFAMLEASVVAAKAESKVGVVCFHPRYAVPDGKSFPGFGQMHSVPRLEKWYRESTMDNTDDNDINMLTTEQIASAGAWQRRTPHATINVLRADQLEIGETRRNSRDLYTENIDKLVGIDGIGSEQLAKDLEYERRLSSTKRTRGIHKSK